MPKAKKEKAVKKTPQVTFGRINYPAGDFLIRVKNAALAGRKVLMVRNTGLIASLAQALKRAGYIDEVVKEDSYLKATISIKRKSPVIMGIKLVSKPGLRIYMGVEDIENKKGPFTLLVSTPKGVLTSKEAVKQRVGGEVLAEVW
jgi:small subunit ribosomal protein S8